MARHGASCITALMAMQQLQNRTTGTALTDANTAHIDEV